jgi:pectate lyase
MRTAEIRRLGGLALALVLAGAGSAQAQLFSDNFNDGNANGWTPTSGSWSVATDGTPVYRVGSNGGNVRSNTGSASWTNYSVQARIKPLAFSSSTSIRWVSLLGRYRDTGNYYYVALQNDNMLRLRRFVGSSSTTLAETALTVTTNTWYTVRLEMNGSALRVFVNDALRLSATDSTFPSGRIAVGAYGASASYDDVVVSAVGGTNPDFGLSANPSSLSLDRGTSRTSTIAITRSGGFTGPVSFTASGLPNGVSASFNPVSTSAGSTVLTLTASATASLGSATVGVNGSGTPGTRSTPISLTVTDPGGAQNFSISASPASVTVTRGGSSSTGVNIARSGGFTGVVSLSIVGALPGGVSASFNPASTTGNSSSLSFAATGSATLGTANVTVRGSGAPGTRDTTVSLTVQPGSTGGGPDGFAAFNGNTTGGAGGATVTATDGAQFVDFINRPEALIIRVQGTLNISGMNRVASNKSILGVGSNAVVNGGGLTIRTASNIIIRNIRFQGSGDDGINIEESSHHIWIDHCDFTNHSDGALDIKRASDFITVSWNHFSNQDKNMLLGHDDGNGSQDRGHLRVTYHHNWFDGTTQRNPRTRFGNPVHVYNNYYLANSGYGMASTMESGILAENNFFENVESPMELGQGDSPPGTLVQRGNVFVNSGPPVSAGSVNPIPYSYNLEAGSSVANSVRNGAGVGRITP